MKRDLAIALSVAALSLAVAAVFHGFLPGFGALFKPLLWPLAALPFLVRPRTALVTAAAVPPLSSLVNGMPPLPTALMLSAAASLAVLLLVAVRRAALRRASRAA